MKFNTLTEWSRHIAKDFRNFEEHEIVVFHDRDASLVGWVIRCLTNPRNEWSAEMLDMLRDELERRKNEIVERPEFGKPERVTEILKQELGEDFPF